jgi:glutathione S-transferase
LESLLCRPLAGIYLNSYKVADTVHRAVKMATHFELQLYVDSRYVSPYAMSAFIALHEKGLAAQILTVDLGTGEHHGVDYAERSLTHRVPMLVHNDFSLSESSAITEYIEERFSGPRIYPEDICARARARQLQAWLRSDLMLIRQERPTDVVFYGPTTQPLSVHAEAAAKRLFSAVEAVLPHGAQYLFGQWSIADVEVALMLNRLVMNGDAVPERLAKFATAQWERPSVQMWVKRQRPPK